MTGAAGRNGIDLDTAARQEVEEAERIFSDRTGKLPTVEYSDAHEFDIDGRPAVHYTAHVTDISPDTEYDPGSARFDVVATPGFATAEVMVLIIELHQNVPGAQGAEVVEGVIASIRPS
ncbi:hypothetical protein DW322_02175 [Rhodococcus rhodnii]|nr:hypothetical protein [Rhodococcus rhodnii]TXG89269.1 hypothetical protein DW322_02175 [Rhodococcus rhodnii]